MWTFLFSFFRFLIWMRSYSSICLSDLFLLARSIHIVANAKILLFFKAKYIYLYVYIYACVYIYIYIYMKETSHIYIDLYMYIWLVSFNSLLISIHKTDKFGSCFSTWLKWLKPWSGSSLTFLHLLAYISPSQRGQLWPNPPILVFCYYALCNKFPQI